MQMCDSWKGHELYEYKFVAIFTFLIPIKTKGHILWHVMDKQEIIIIIIVKKN
jgi:hypothetical protein